MQNVKFQRNFSQVLEIIQNLSNSIFYYLVSKIKGLKRDDEIKRILEQRNHADETPLHVAAKYDQEHFIRFLLLRNVWVDITDQQQNTPLHTAIK